MQKNWGENGEGENLPVDQVAEHPHSTFDYVNPADKVCFAVLVTIVLCILLPCHQTSGTRQLLRKSLQYQNIFLKFNSIKEKSLITYQLPHFLNVTILSMEQWRLRFQ